MKILDTIYGPAENLITTEEQKARKRRIFFDIVLLIAWAICVPTGAIPQYNTILSLMLVVCFLISFSDENLYIYTALFMYMRYRMLIGDEPAYRIYSYLVALRFLIDLPKTKFRVIYLPAIFVFILHSIFALTNFESMRIALNVIVDVVLAYIVLMNVLKDERLFRKYLFFFIMGGVLSGMYGWLNTGVAVDINVAGAGVHTVNRNFGALGDPNFAGLFYALCVVTALMLKGIPRVLRLVFIAIFGILILQTASLSAILTLIILSVFTIILKFRGKSVAILSVGTFAVIVVTALLLAIPQFRQIDAVNGLIIRVNEKLSYIPRGRWDLLTTDRWDIWSQAMGIFLSKPLWAQLIGGSVITVMARDPSINFACHNSYIQSILNFGVLGMLMIYIPLFLTFGYRLIRHFGNDSGYEKEDIRIIQLCIMFAFIFFGMTVDFFIDWTYMIFCFI